MGEKIKCKLLFSSVANDASGIHLRMEREDEKLEVCFLPVGEQLGDINLVLKEGMDPRTELEKVANLLNGYQILPGGSITPLPGFVPKTITLINET